MNSANFLMLAMYLAIALDIKSQVSADPYHYRPSVVKVGIHLEPIVGKPIELLCNTTLDDLQRISSYKINLKDWQCQWLFYGRQSKFSAASESRAKYHVTLNQDNYKGQRIFCNHPISTLRLDHDGYYKCQFLWEDVAADIFSTVQSDPLDLSVLYAPTGQTEITMSPDLRWLKDGMSVTLTCLVHPSAAGKPLPTYKWRQIDNSTFWHNQSVLSLSEIIKTDSDTYQTYACLPENKVGKGSLATVNVGIIPIPFLTFTDIIADHTTIQFGWNESSVNLTCAAVGYPQFSLHWCDENEQDCKNISQIIRQSAMEDVVERSSQIKQSFRYSGRVTRNVSAVLNQRQEDQWSCVALHSHGKWTEILKQKTVYLAKKRGPEFCLNRTVVHGVGASSTATLQCQASGRPRPELTWSVLNKEGTLVDLQSSTGITVGQEIISLNSDKASKNLMIWKVSAEDAKGRYFCTAANKYGRIQLKFIFNLTDSDELLKTGVRFRQVAKSAQPAQTNSFSKEAIAVACLLGAAVTILMIIGVVIFMRSGKDGEGRILVVAKSTAQSALVERVEPLYDVPKIPGGRHYVD